MNINKTKLEGVFIIERTPFTDDRGEFCRMFCQDEFAKAGLNYNFVQSNISKNHLKGTLRGLHSQKQEFAEDKLVCAISGRLLDVCVDVRENSPTFGQYIQVELTADNNISLYIPKGFAHGYLTLEDNSSILYFTTQFYTSSSEKGYRYDDPAFNIDWGDISKEKLLLSKKDLSCDFI